MRNLLKLTLCLWWACWFWYMPETAFAGKNDPPPLAEALVEVGGDTVILDGNDRNTVIVPQAAGSSTGCDTAGASIGVKAGGFALSFPTYPCEVARSHEAIAHAYELDADGTRKHGFVTGTMPAFFLKVRLITKGLFSAVFGLFGLG